jgi:hypothetical protein
VNAAVLLGERSAKIHQTGSEDKCQGTGNNQFSTPNGVCTNLYTTTTDITRSHHVTVPNLGGYAGLSLQYNDAKISLGYRVDEFFNAMDGGQDSAKKYDRGFYGPYLNVSLGFGG